MAEKSIMRDNTHHLDKTNSGKSQKMISMYYLKLASHWIEVFGTSFVALGLSYTPIDDKRVEGFNEDFQHEKKDLKNDQVVIRTFFRDFLRVKYRAARITFNADDKVLRLELACVALGFYFRSMMKNDIELAGVEAFQDGCPTSGRRSQTSVFLKLLVATMITMTIHGHHGSLIAPKSWRGGFFHASEVILSPLASTVKFIMNLWPDLVNLLVPQRRPWTLPSGYQFRLARVCSFRVYDTSNQLKAPNALYLDAVNPEHLDAVPKKRDLSWVGRIIMLTVLLAQYSQACLILSRRLLANTYATIDIATLCLVISGLSTLVQSLAILSMNATWTIRPDTKACDNRACQRAECITLKQEKNISESTFRTMLLGIDVTGIPRIILFELVGGLLQGLLLKRREEWRTLTFFADAWIAIVYWSISIRAILTIELTQKRLYGEAAGNLGNVIDGTSASTTSSNSISETESEKHPTEKVSEITTTEDPDFPPDPPSNDTFAPPARNKFSTRKEYILDLAFYIFKHVGCLMLGLGSLLFAIGSILFVLYNIFWPPGLMYTRIIKETTAWKSHNTTSPCPEMWNDRLEDELWWL